MVKFILAMLCLLDKTDQFGLYDDSMDIKIFDENDKKIRFFAEKVENQCLDGIVCSRKKFQEIIPVTVLNIFLSI